MAQSRPFSLHSEHITNPSSIPLPGEFKEFSLDPQLWQQTCLIVTHLGKVEEALIQRQRGLPELAELVRLRSDVYTQCAGMTWGQALLQPQCLARTNNLAAEVRAHDMEEIVLLFIIPKHTRKLVLHSAFPISYINRVLEKLIDARKGFMFVEANLTGCNVHLPAYQMKVLCRFICGDPPQTSVGLLPVVPEGASPLALMAIDSNPDAFQRRFRDNLIVLQEGICRPAHDELLTGLANRVETRCVGNQLAIRFSTPPLGKLASQALLRNFIPRAIWTPIEEAVSRTFDDDVVSVNLEEVRLEKTDCDNGHYATLYATVQAK